MGEYNILNPGYSAIGVSTQRGITMTLFGADETVITRANQPFELQRGDLLFCALSVCKDYLDSQAIALESFHINIESTLEEEGKKYGLGSSGAVLVCFLAIVLRFHDVVPDSLTLYKLAMIAQHRFHDQGSGMDLAISIYQGLVYYRHPDVRAIDFSQSVDLILCQPWPKLEIERLNPLHTHFYAGWTGQPFNSGNFVARVLRQMEIDPAGAAAHFDRAQAMVEAVRLEPESLAAKITAYQHWMQDFAEWAGLPILTAELAQLLADAEALGLAAKISGAGGGDCGIALGSSALKAALQSAWANHGLEMIEEKEI